MDEPIPKISIQDLSTLLGAALGGPVRAADLHEALLKPQPREEPQRNELIEQLLRGARRQ